MNRATTVLIFLILFESFLFFSCSKKADDADLTLSQNDINLLIKHKKQIDKITEKYDLELQKVKPQMKKQIIEKGKDEINRYLKSKDLNPVIFMRKSKKILRGYLAFYETGPESLKIKTKMLESQNLTEKQYNAALEVYRESDQRLFREYTTDLSDYEIELIKMNLKNLAAIVKYPTEPIHENKK